MLLTEFLQICSACTGVIGALFFAIGVIRQNVGAMVAISGTYYGSNLYMKKSLAAQKADYIFGGGIIVVTFVLQLASFLVPPQARVFSPEVAQIVRWSMVVATFFVFFALRYLSAKLSQLYFRQIAEWQRSKQEPKVEV